MSYKSYDHTCNNTLARISNVIDNVHVRFSIEIMFTLKAINFILKGHMIESYTRGHFI